MKIHFRSIKEADFQFLWRLHNAALKDYVKKTWGWDEEWQRKNFLENFKIADGEIIVFEGQDIGFWWVIEKENEILLASIRLLPEFQNKGIGTGVIRDLLDKTNKPVSLQVLKVNPARNLYERLGFEIVGETKTHFWMRRE
ncbi:MAG TPA: GNAT family N-acetyltransferase [Pyrinomonadaceae bacterium]|nr:GNAT family N-acetyltransferase [Pyrinomonadaceae bacterium]